MKEIKDARLIGYGATLGEGTLALAATIAAIAGISLVQTNPDFCLPWACDFKQSNPLDVFILGSSGLLQSIGIPISFATTLIVVLVVSFAATTLDSATRIQRYIITEFGSATTFTILENKYLATLISVVPAYFIATDNTLRNDLWTTFGASNQMLAALTLMVLSIYFYKKKKNVTALVIPMIIVMSITISALIIKFKNSTNNLISIINGILIFLIIWMIIEGLICSFKIYKEMKKT